MARSSAASRTARRCRARCRFAVTPRLDVTVSEDFGYQEPVKYFGSILVNGQLERVASRRQLQRRRRRHRLQGQLDAVQDGVAPAAQHRRPQQLQRALLEPVLARRRDLRLRPGDADWSIAPASSRSSTTSSSSASTRRPRSAARSAAAPTPRRSGSTTPGRASTTRTTRRTAASSAVPLTNPEPGRVPQRRRYQPGVHARARTSTRCSSRTGWCSTSGGRSSAASGWIVTTSIGTRCGSGTTASRTFTPANWRGGARLRAAPRRHVLRAVRHGHRRRGHAAHAQPAQQLFDLTPGRQIEVGAKQSFANGRAEWTVAGVSASSRRSCWCRTRTIRRCGSRSASSRRRAIELSASVDVGAGLRVDASLAMLDARYDDFTEVIGGVVTSWAGNTPTNVPERVGSLWLAWNLPRQWLVQGGLRYIGSRYLNNANTVTTPSATVVDASVRRRLTERVSVDVRATNLFDKFYLQSVSGAPIPLRGRIGPPRAVEADAQHELLDGHGRQRPQAPRLEDALHLPPPVDGDRLRRRVRRVVHLRRGHDVRGHAASVGHGAARARAAARPLHGAGVTGSRPRRPMV